MARRYSDYYYPYYPPSHPRKAEGGIKINSKKGEMVKKWWSKRFIEILTSFGWESRLQRGRRYARAGQVLRVNLGKGTISAEVQGSMSMPYRVEIKFPEIPEKAWTKIMKAMEQRPEFTSLMLAGEIKPEIEDLFLKSGSSLFPARSTDMQMSCSCPDYANPCKHIAAVFYVMADTFDADPFILLQLRGKTKEEIVASISKTTAKNSNPVKNELSEGKSKLSKEYIYNFWKEPKVAIPRRRSPTVTGITPLKKYPLPTDFSDETIEAILSKYLEQIRKGLEKISA